MTPTTAPASTPTVVVPTTVTPAQQKISIYSDEIGNVMATIRDIESRGQWSVPAQTTSTPAVTVETTDNNNEVDSEWVITSTGQVQGAH